MALKGTLEDFGIADIFQLIGQQQKTGLLMLARNDQEVHIRFRDGYIISAESKNRDIAERLGAMMAQAGLITQAQLEQTLDIQKKTLQKLGAILLEKNFIKKSDLDEFIYLQTKETIFRLFRWNKGTYEFEPSEVNVPSEFFQPISAEHILMDGFRIIDEWPSIRKKIGSFETVFEKVPGKSISVSHASLDGHDDVDKAFSAFEEGRESVENTEKLDHNAEKIFEIIDGKKNVAQLIAVARLGEFDTTRALVNLLELNWIRSQRRSAEVSTPQDQDKLTIDLYQDYQSPKKNVLQMLPSLLYAISLGLTLTLLASYLGVGPFRNIFRSQRDLIDRNVYRELISDYRLDLLRLHLELYYAEKNHYPNGLEELSHLGRVKSVDLHFPWQNRYIYESDGTTYKIAKPFD